jgi:hypothetical protein
MTRTARAPLFVCETTLIVASLFACTRPEPSESNVGRLRPNAAPNQTVGSTAQRVIPHESEPPVINPPEVDPNPSTIPSSSAESAADVDIATAIADARRGGRSDVDYVVPESSILAAYRGYLGRLFLAPGPSEFTPQGAPNGFRVDALGSNCVALLEQPNRRHGAAAVVVRTGEARPMAVEVPHSFFDESTLPIGLALFEVAHARALLVNTVHRYRSLAGKEPDDAAAGDDAATTANSDVAHAERSFFLSAHEAFVYAFPKGIAVQIHGFRDNKADGIDAILSAANTRATLEPMAARLREHLGLKVALYPRDTHQLGGTKNAQAQLSRRSHQPLVHLELSQTLRQRLVRDKSLMHRFAAAIASETR